MLKFKSFLTELTDKQKEEIKKRKELRLAGKLPGGPKKMPPTKVKREIVLSTQHRELPSAGDLAKNRETGNYYIFPDFFQVTNHRDNNKSYGTISLHAIIQHLIYIKELYARKKKKNPNLAPLDLIKDAHNVYMLQWITFPSVFDISPGKYDLIKYKSDEWFKVVGEWADYFVRYKEEGE